MQVTSVPKFDDRRPRLSAVSILLLVFTHLRGAAVNKSVSERAALTLTSAERGRSLAGSMNKVPSCFAECIPNSELSLMSGESSSRAVRWANSSARTRAMSLESIRTDRGVLVLRVVLATSSSPRCTSPCRLSFRQEGCSDVITF